MPALQTIQLRRGAAALWTAINPVLAQGEPGHETDTGCHKIGDGITAWTALPYALPPIGTFVPISLTTAGAPTTGTWLTNQSVVDKNGIVWNCTAGSSPGPMSWVQASGAPAVVAAQGNLGATPTLALGGKPVVLGTGTLNADCALTLTGLTAGCKAELYVDQDGTGGWSLSINDGTGAVPVSINRTAGATTALNLTYDGTNLRVTYGPQLGTPGSTGGPGIQGLPGVNGSIWWTGVGAPGTVIGAVTGDYYLNRTNGNVYKSTAGPSTWASLGFTIQGPAGLNGTPVTMPDVTSPPAGVAGETQLFAMTRAGRGLPFAAPEIGTPFALGSALYAKTFIAVFANTGTVTPVTIGMRSSATVTGTAAVSGVSVNGVLQNIVSAATIGAIASLNAQLTFRWVSSPSALYGGFLYKSKFYLPDASYTSGSGSRVAVGMSNNPATDLGANHGLATNNQAMFAMAPGDTNWQFVVGNGAAQNITDTGLVFTPQHLYSAYIYLPAGSSTVSWFIEDLTTGTTQSGSTSTDTPTGTTLAPFVGLCTIDATARNIQFTHVFCESDKG